MNKHSLIASLIAGLALAGPAAQDVRATQQFAAR